MPITKAAGNMYDWITHTHSHLRGACPHACPYCYVQAIGRRFNSPHHQGPVMIAEKELAENYSSPRVLREAREMGHDTPVIFIEHASDLFAQGVSPHKIDLILDHCSRYPSNTYVFQTKDPCRMEGWIHLMPPRRILGATLESDITHVGQTPDLQGRAVSMRRIPNVWPGIPTFITVEPVLRFTPRLAEWIINAAPTFVNIGADSKATPGLPEPTPDELLALIETLTAAGVQIRRKTNLERLLRP